MSDVVVAYVPVLHEGYRRFLEAHARGRPLFLIGAQLYADYRPLAKDIRCLDADLAARSIAAWGLCSEVAVLDVAGAVLLASQAPSITLPAEDVSYRVVERFFDRCPVRYDTTFLRWDRSKSVQLLVPGDLAAVSEGDALADITGVEAEAAADVSGLAEADGVADSAGVQAEAAAEVSGLAEADAAGTAESDVAAAAEAAAGRSIDWWRQVGAAIRFAGGEVVAAANEHLPHPLAAYAAGDPRSNFYKGVHFELSTAEHAEARLIAQAARSGVATEGAVMYVTDFPCPPCAKLIAAAGVAKLYFRNGYAVLDGRDVLERAGVEIVRVEAPVTA